MILLLEWIKVVSIVIVISRQENHGIYITE
jgi:hypothetical protein